MSHSVVKVTQAPVDESVVIVVGEDGSVSLDRETLESLLSSNDGPTELNVVHVNQGDGATLDVTVDRIDVQPDAMDELILETDEVTRNYNNFRMDHDYTPLTSPSQVNAEDELAQTLRMLEGHGNVREPPPPIAVSPVTTKVRQKQITVTKQQIPTRFKGQAVQKPQQTTAISANFTPNSATRTITVQKQPLANRNGKKIITKVAPKVLQQQNKKVPPTKPTAAQKKQFVVADDADEDEQESEVDEFELEEDSEDSDDNSDVDFEEIMMKARANKRNRGRKRIEATPQLQKPQRIRRRGPRKQSSKVSPAAKSVEPPKPPVTEEPPPKPPVVEVSTPKKPPVQKKEKKTPKPFVDDGIALFSTPDIIRRVGSTDASPPKNQAPKPAKIGQEGRSRSNSDRSSTDKLHPQSKSRSSVDSKSSSPKRRSVSTDSSTKNATDNQKSATPPSQLLNRADSQQQQAMIVEPQFLNESGSNCDDDDDSMMDTLEPMPSAEDIRAIIHTDAKSFTTSLVLNDSSNSSTVQVLSTPVSTPVALRESPQATTTPAPQTANDQQQQQTQMKPPAEEQADQSSAMDQSGMNLDSAGLEIDQAILDNISRDELISEDILYQVAKLVENTDIQTVIDRSFSDADLRLATGDSAMGSLPQQVMNAAAPAAVSSVSSAAAGIVMSSSVTGGQEMQQQVNASMAAAVISSSSVQQNVGITASMSSSTSSTTSTVFANNQVSDERATANKNTPGAKQIIRPDGRVLILPPIEKPATRSANKKKISDDEHESPPSKNAPKPVPSDAHHQQHHRHQQEAVVSNEGEMYYRMVEGAGETAAPVEAVPAKEDGEEGDTDSDESWNSEDDPDRLWCICKQPHNNRFMICCDTCEDWFHGKCVNITKAMGQQMELEGREWICPNCLKKKDGGTVEATAPSHRVGQPGGQHPQNQQTPPPRPVPSITPAQRRRSKASSETVSSPSESAAPSSSGGPSRRQSTSSGGSETAGTCLVCGATSRSSSVYCSDQCILKHAQGVERVVVFERATGKILSGSNAPSAANAKQWLQQHPGFELVRTATNKVFKRMTQSKLKLVKNSGNDGGVSLAVQHKGVPKGILRHVPKGQQPTVQTVINKKGQKFQIIAKHMPTHPQPKQIKLIQPVPLQQKQQVQGGQPNTPPVQKQVRVHQASIKTFTLPKMEKPPSLHGTTPTKAPKPVPKLPPETTSGPAVRDHSQDQENIRESVRKTLTEHLAVRLKGNAANDINLSADDVSKLCTEIELQLYKHFGATGPKYRNKYRSLTFNIKDPKNQTLWRRICDKSITPAQLVKLSPDDLASQELSQWRERETKHQLEMIKKSELELLQCNRTYVLKTHKGEEVMEERRPTSTVDSTEVVASLGPDSSSTAESEEKESKEDKDREERSRSSERTKSSSSKHSRRDKDKHSSRRSSKDRKRRSTSRDRRKRSRSRDRKKRDKSRDRHGGRRSSSHKSSRHKRDGERSAAEKLDKKSKEILEQLVDKQIVPPLEDRLWKHVQHEDMVQREAESDSDHEPTSTVTIPTPPRSTTDGDELSKRITGDEEGTKRTLSVETTQSVKTQQESGSTSSRNKKQIAEEAMDEDVNKTVSPPSPSASELTSTKSQTNKDLDQNSRTGSPSSLGLQAWKGTINMVDVAQISITAHIVSGDVSPLASDLQTNLDIVGRISPDTVWDYILKMKCSNSKTISVLRLTATNMEEKMPYIALYSYLSSRNRLGVVKCTNKYVKDFYILPLATSSPIPQALLPLTGVGFGEDPRPPLLIGIIVRTKKKRGLSSAADSGTPVTKKTKVEVRVATPPPRSYTPPPSDKASARVDPRISRNAPVTVPLPQASSTPSGDEDDDEPYSPEDSDVEALPASATPSNPLINLDLSSVLKATTSFYESQIKISQAQTFEPFINKFDSIPGLGDENAAAAVDTTPASSLELQRKMAELDKCIEQRKREIHSMSQDLVTAVAPAGASSTSDLGTSALANIALPSNLQQILDSIKGISPATPDLTEEYSPSAPSFSKTDPDLTIPLLLPKISSRTTKVQINTSSGGGSLKQKITTTTAKLSRDGLMIGSQREEVVVLPDVSVPPPNLLAAAAAASSALPPPTIPLNLPTSKKKPPAAVPPPSTNLTDSLPAPMIPPSLLSTPPPQIHKPPHSSGAPTAATTTTTSSSSVLSSLSEEELIRKAAEMLGETTEEDDRSRSKTKESSASGESASSAHKKSTKDSSAADSSDDDTDPAPPGTENDEVLPGFPGKVAKNAKALPVSFSPPAPHAKRAKIDLNQPPIPGLEDF